MCGRFASFTARRTGGTCPSAKVNSIDMFSLTSSPNKDSIDVRMDVLMCNCQACIRGTYDKTYGITVVYSSHDGTESSYQKLSYLVVPGNASNIINPGV